MGIIQTQTLTLTPDGRLLLTRSDAKTFSQSVTFDLWLVSQTKRFSYAGNQ